MKRNKARIALLIIGVVVGLTGCHLTKEAPNTKETQQTEQSAETTVLEKVTIVIKTNDAVLSDKQLEIEKEETLLSVMKKHFTVVEDKGFITSIENRAADNSKREFWAILINGEMAQIGAADLKLRDGDVVTFEIQTY